LSIERLALGLREAIPAASLVLITDAVHDQRLGDLVLMGPNARSWPALPGEVLCLSATGPTELPVATPFGRLVTDGLAGAADASGDGAVTSGELVRFVQVQMSAAVGAVAHPVESGAAAPDMVLARVRRGPADFPDYQPERTRVRQRRAAGAAVAGLGAALGFAGLGFYLDALKVYPYVQDDPRERLDPEPGQTYQGLRDRYQRDWLLVPITFAASGTLLASGGALLVWPAPGGVGVGVQARF
jgi:hypothetical protein